MNWSYRVDRKSYATESEFEADLIILGSGGWELIWLQLEIGPRLEGENFHITAVFKKAI